MCALRDSSYCRGWEVRNDQGRVVRLREEAEEGVRCKGSSAFYFKHCVPTYLVFVLGLELDATGLPPQHRAVAEW